MGHITYGVYSKKYQFYLTIVDSIKCYDYPEHGNYDLDFTGGIPISIHYDSKAKREKVFNALIDKINDMIEHHCSVFMIDFDSIENSVLS
jgi:hypothetical protein